MRRLFRWPALPRLRLPRLTAEALNLVVFVVGLLLFGVGLSLWYLPAGLTATGAVVMGWTLFGGGRRA